MAGSRGLKGMDRVPREHPRVRRNAQRLAGDAGSLFGGAIAIDDAGLIILLLQTDCGLIQDTTGLAINPGTGLAVSGDTVALSHLGIDALTDPGGDRIFFWDESVNAAKWLTAGTVLTITDTTLAVDATAFVPYVGAIADVNLGIHNLITTGSLEALAIHDGTATLTMGGDPWILDTNLQAPIFFGDLSTDFIDSLSGPGTLDTSGDPWVLSHGFSVGANALTAGSLTDGTRTLTMGAEPWTLSHDFKVDKATGFAHMEVIGNDNGASMAVETKAPTNNKYSYYLFKEDGANKYGWIYYQGNGDYYVYDYANSKIMLYYDQSDPELELMASAHGNIACFPRTDVGDAVDGKQFRVWRKAAEGDNSFALYIDKDRIGKMATDVARWDIATVIKPAGYQSSDGSAGITQSENGVTDFDIVIKDGLITSFTVN